MGVLTARAVRPCSHTCISIIGAREGDGVRRILATEAVYIRVWEATVRSEKFAPAFSHRSMLELTHNQDKNACDPCEGTAVLGPIVHDKDG